MIFLWFSTNFQSFSKSRRDRFTNRPSNFADRPSGRKFRLQLGPWRHGRRWKLNSSEGKARLGRESVGECLGAHLRPIPGVGRLRGRAGEGARRHQPPVAAASSPPAKLRRGWANTRHWRIHPSEGGYGATRLRKRAGGRARRGGTNGGRRRPVRGTVGGFYSLPAPWLARRSKSSPLLRSMATGLGRCAQQGVGRRTVGQYAAAVRRGTKMRSHSKDGRREGDQRPWPRGVGERAHTDAEAGAAPWARRAAQLNPAERPAHRRRSGARPCCFPARQHDFDCVFLQKDEPCDKNGRYESCR
jgi:hypothetical protein